MFETKSLMVLIPALPLAAAIIVGLLGRRWLKEYSHVPVVLALAGSCVFSLLLLKDISNREPDAKQVGVEVTHTLWTWAAIPAAGVTTPQIKATPNFQIDITLRADPLTCMMLPMVTFIATLVAIYAMGYMHGDPGYWRFYAYVGLFVFSMTMLVSVSNFALLYVFWEAVGVCSYLLIGFWFEKPEAAAAGKKAFLVNRVGDFGFAFGLFLIWVSFGTLNFHDAGDVQGVLGQTLLANPARYAEIITGSVALAIPLLLMVGACGKSAQFPLHVWLPDAMEGPTPVSALIHAATMVTAGVYMVTRCSPLFMLDPRAQLVVACIGGFTALLAGLIALTQTDLKRVLAYSTVSQLGYMFLALGTGSLAGIVAGMFHLFTHAFFKALLFLGAGSVMHGMHHIIDMRRFSGLRRVMPWTCLTFLIGSLALAGIVPLAGFWSKDQVLAAVHDRAHDGGPFVYLYYSAVLTAFLTAFYTARAFFMTFMGPLVVPHEVGDHAHESPPAMVFPLVVLAICSIFVGITFDHSLGDFIVRTPSLACTLVAGEHGLEHHFHWDIAAISTVVAVLGIAIAAYFYLGDRRQINALTRIMQGVRLYGLSNRKFFFDEIYHVLFVLPLKGLAALSYLIDRWLVDGLVNLCGWIPRAVGAVLRNIQTGVVQFYALAMVLGLALLIGTLLVWKVG
ncbi:MAG: NADH-quinone oxidoreductase subunit L [Planctomycetaceae bacterium]|nr:NADH-quinone oxidoreductase subunit L [Planctomycetaceae bacterium]